MGYDFEGGSLYLERLIHGGAYFRNLTVYFVDFKTFFIFTFYISYTCVECDKDVMSYIFCKYFKVKMVENVLQFRQLSIFTRISYCKTGRVGFMLLLPRR